MLKSDDQDGVASATANRKLYPPSPCISICTLDEAGRCRGCGRTIDQIRDWTRMTREQQWAVVDELAAGNAVCEE